MNNKFRYGCKTKKRRYPSYSVAFHEMLRINNHKHMQEGPLKNIYQCQRCNGWHLTRKAPA